MPFPKNFFWGAATAAYQVEGATNEDGRSPCIWDTLSPGHTCYDEDGTLACDHYHRFREDVALMKKMGLKSYRFSVSWPRVLPGGTGEINQKGIDFYKALVDELVNAGIEPMVTLYHWDLPYVLYQKGGWLNPESPEWFAAYTRAVVEALSPKVKYWMTFNEPQCFVGIGYSAGVHAPFIDQPLSQLPVTRNVLLAHGRAVQVIRECAVTPPQIGFAPTGGVFLPHGDSEAAIDEARRLTFSDKCGTFSVARWCDPVLRGSIAPDAAAALGTTPEGFFTPEEWRLVAQPLDFLGFNIYQAQAREVDGSQYPDTAFMGSPRTTMDWAITPDGIYWAVRFLYERYGLPVLITENGMSNVDSVMLDGAVHDPQRIDFVHRYLLALRRAVDEGVPVLGYTYWSLMDNYEWANGYKKRFGLIYVDYATQRRIPKDSAAWYAKVIATNGECL